MVVLRSYLNTRFVGQHVWFQKNVVFQRLVFLIWGSCVHCKHGHACNRIMECAVRGFLVCIQTETFVFLLLQGSTDLPLQATRDIFHAGMTLVCIQTENFVFLWWQGSTDSPLEATRDIFHAGMTQWNKSVYAWCA